MEKITRIRKMTGRKAKKVFINNWLKMNKEGQFARNDELFRLARMKKKMEEKAKK